MTTAHLAAAGYEEQLATELGRAGVEVTHQHGRLHVVEGPELTPAWAANTWHDAVELPAPSIAAAARTLRDIQRNWAVYAPTSAGRARLIAERLPHVSARPLAIDELAPTAPLGSWTLLSDGRMLASARCSSAFPNGEIALQEDKVGPPSRAYLKLWEALVRLGRRPAPGDQCLDLGASPGGWTWYLAQLGASVIAVDKAPLATDVDALANVSCHAGSAFALDPADWSAASWLFSDVVCYPRRMLGLVRRWIDAGWPGTIVCTVKFQGDTHHDVSDALAALPGAQLFHLHHNKHELTFVRVAAGAGAAADS